jgi:hypothetical protein
MRQSEGNGDERGSSKVCLMSGAILHIMSWRLLCEEEFGPKMLMDPATGAI